MRLPKIFMLSAITVSSSFMIAACGGGGGAVVKPKDYKAVDALGVEAPVCKSKPSYARPLTIDLDSDTRSDLQASMDKGVVVVAYDCVHLRVLNCTAPSGAYEYARTDRKEDVVQLKGMDDLKVNLPLGAAKLSGEISAGRSIDLALVSIGRQTTTVFAVPRGELKGQCEGATHYVQKAFLGAFSIATGSNGKVSAVAEMFSRSAAGSSSLERSGQQINGSLDACRKSENRASAPTPECQTAVRVELTPIEDGKATELNVVKNEKRNVDVALDPCRDGFKLVDNACVPAAAAKSAKTGYLCEATNAEECKAECAKGNAGSCANAGALAFARWGEVSYEVAIGEAIPLFKKSCDGGDQNGCAGFAKLSFPDDLEGGKKSALANDLLEMGKKACDAGIASACQELGYRTNPEVFPGFKWSDADTSMMWFDRGCKLGDAFACGAAGKVALVKGDVKKGIAFYMHGCDGGDANVCNQIGKGFIQGKRGIPQDADKGAKLAMHGCDINVETCAFSAALLTEAGKSDAAEAAAKRGCEDKDVRTNLTKDEKTLANEYRGQACTYLGHLIEKKDPKKAQALFKAACDHGDDGGCTAAKTTSAETKPRKRPKK